MIFDVYVYFPNATFPSQVPGERVPYAMTGCFSRQHLDLDKVDLGWLINKLFDDPDCPHLWGVQTAMIHGRPEWVELRPGDGYENKSRAVAEEATA
jgi:hypothetical protein